MSIIIQEGSSYPTWYPQPKQKVYVGHLHHYSRSVPLIWDTITKLVSPQFHVVDKKFEIVQPPNRDDKIDDTVDILFKTNNYKYDDLFGNAHPYILSYHKRFIRNR
jgi:hypothetical protein